MARDDFSGWVEKRALGTTNSANIIKFIWKDIIYRYKSFRTLVLDGGPENKNNIIALRDKYSFRRIQTIIYNSKANNIVERKHSPIIRAFLTLTNNGKGN